MENRITFSNILTSSFTLFINNFKVMLCLFLAYLVTVVAAIVTAVVCNVTSIVTIYKFIRSNPWSYLLAIKSLSIGQWLLFSMSLFLALIIFAINGAGVTNCILHIVKKLPISLETYLQGWKFIPQFIVLTLVFTPLALLSIAALILRNTNIIPEITFLIGSAAFIIPGIIFVICAAFAHYILINENCSALQAIKRSFRQTKGFRGLIFGFFVLWCLLASKAILKIILLDTLLLLFFSVIYANIYVQLKKEKQELI